LTLKVIGEIKKQSGQFMIQIREINYKKIPLYSGMRVGL